MLKKLSLAALVAMGSMSVASATDLSEAIKGVDLKGALRIRLYHDDSATKKTSNTWRTNAAFIFAVPVTEDLKLVDRISNETQINAQDGTGANTVNATVKDNVLFAKYSKNGLTVLAGKIPVATPITDNDLFGPPTHGAGALATYKVSDSLTLAAAGLDALVAEDYIGTTVNNTYAAAAIFKSDIADVQVWAFEMDKTINSDYVISADIKAIPAVKLHVDYATADLDNKHNNTLSSYKQSFKNISASFTQDAVCVKVGFAANGENGGFVVIDGDAPLTNVLPTPQNSTLNKDTADKAFYGKLGYNVNEKTNVYAAYAKADDAGTEGVIGAKYKYTKKFTLSAYYSVTGNIKGGNGNKETRAEAIYKF